MLIEDIYKETEQSCLFVTWTNSTCDNDRVCPGWSKFKCHLVFVFVHSQMVLIGKPLEQVKEKKIQKVSTLYKAASG